MSRPKLLCIWLSSLLLAMTTPALHAQTAGRTRDTTQTVAHEDSLRQSRSWLSSLLNKIARRSDDSTAVAATVVDSAEVEPDAPARSTPAGAKSARSFKSRRDSVEWESARRTAERAEGFRIIVDIFAHQLYVINEQGDTLRTAPAATAMNSTLSYGGRTWRFETPRGVRRVLSKDKEPTWTRPEWHFAEVALEHGLKLRTLQRGQTVHLRDGTRLLTQGDEVGIIAPGTKEFLPLVLDEHIVFDNTLFIPPGGTQQRTIQGELGHFRLALGDGYQLHGTPYASSVGNSVTHGCVRLHDEDIEWLYDNVPVGTKVYIY
jgi:hypothetical protein